jgi:hypothetical protein
MDYDGMNLIKSRQCNSTLLEPLKSNSNNKANILTMKMKGF